MIVNKIVDYPDCKFGKYFEKVNNNSKKIFLSKNSNRRTQVTILSKKLNNQIEGNGFNLFNNNAENE
jgi:hypothetical protein